MRIFVVAKRLIKQIGGDKRSLGLMFVAPVFIIYLLYVILTSATTTPVIAVKSIPDQIKTVLEEKVDLVDVNNEEEAITLLKQNEADAYIIFSTSVPKIVIEGTDPAISKLVNNMVNTAFTQINLQPSHPSNGLMIAKPEIEYLYGYKDMSTFDSLAPLLMGYLIFFFVFIISGISFLRERISGTLERTLATPLRRGEIVLGYFLGFGIFVVLQTIIIQSFMLYGLDIYSNGAFWMVLIINILLATMALSLGTFLSAFARNEFQLFQFIPAVIVPQIMFSGIFDLSEAPHWVLILSKIFPLTYGAEALRDIMIRGLSIGNDIKDIIVLLCYIAAFLLLNTLALKKYRKV